MFTAARLIAALCLAGLGYLGSEYVKVLVDESKSYGFFTYYNTAIGFFCGWIIVGPRAGRGMASAISHGVTGTAALVFWALLLQAVNEMVDEAMSHKYHGPMEAFAAIFELMVEFGATLLDTGFIMMLVIGALVAGCLSEIASRYWR